MKKLGPSAGKVASLLALTAIALSLTGSSVSLCGAGCYAADLSHYGSHANPQVRPSWSADGSRIAFVYWGTIYIVDADGSSMEPVVEPDSDLEWFESPFSPAISPDGAQVAYVHNSDSCRVNFDIFVSDIDGSNRRRLTEHAGTDTRPVWSPDGQRIAFLSDRESQGHDFGFGTFAHFTMNANGSDVRKVSSDVSLSERVVPAWSPDGQRLAFVAAEREEKSVSWTSRYSDNGASDPQTSDQVVSREVIYTAGAGGTDLVKLWDGTVGPGFTPRLRTDGSHLHLPEESISGLTWSPNGRHIAFTSAVYGESPTFQLMDAEALDLRQIPTPNIPVPAESESLGNWLAPMAWSSDGSDLLFWLLSNWAVPENGDFKGDFHSGIYSASPDDLSTEFLGDFPLPQMENIWPFYPGDGGIIAAHPSGVAVYFTNSINIHTDTLL